MKIIKKLEVDKNYEVVINKIEKVFSSEYGLYKMLNDDTVINFTVPSTLRYKKVSETIDEYDLNIDSKREFHKNINQYINSLNFYIKFNIVDEIEYSAELLSTIYVSSGFDLLIEQLEKNYNKPRGNKIIRTIQSQRFSDAVYEKLKLETKSNADFYKEFFSAIENSAGKEKLNTIITYYNNMVVSKPTLKLFFKKIAEHYLERVIAEPSVEYTPSANSLVSSMSSEEKIEWLIQNNPEVAIYEINIQKILKSTFGSDLTEFIYNSDLRTLSSLNNKYKQLLNSITMDSYSCRLYKTILYLALYFSKDTSLLDDIEPIQYMRNILNRNTTWAVGTAATSDPSFYGDSDAWKATYGYYSYMTGEVNPYKNIINNKQVDEMDTYAIAIHEYFRDRGFADIFYNLIFEKGIVGDKSLYDILGISKNLIELLEEPLVITSPINDALTQLKGLVGSMINSALGVLDLSLSEIIKKLFYVEFIPINGKKYTLAQIYNYLAFIKTILEYFDAEEYIGTIDALEFVNKVYENLGTSADSLQSIGYGTYDANLNLSKGISNYDGVLYTYEGDTFYLKDKFKVLYSLIQYAIQKNVSIVGSSYVSTINYGSQTYLKSLLSGLSAEEIFFVMDMYGIDFARFDSNFNNFKLGELIDFNDTLKDITYLKNHLSSSTALYDAFCSKNLTVLNIDMTAKFFDTCQYNTFINKSLTRYFTIVTENKTNLAKAIYQQNDVADVDDFLMRFLPAFGEIAKIAGIDNPNVAFITKCLGYILDFFTDYVFKELFFKLKLLINEEVKRFTSDLFSKLELDTGEKVITFDFGGKELTAKIDKLMELLEDFTLSSAVTNNCFKDALIESISISELAEDSEYINASGSNINANEEKVSEILENSSSVGSLNASGNVTDKEKQEVLDSIKSDAAEEKFINVDKLTSSVLEKVIQKEQDNNVIKKPDKVIYDNGNIYVKDEDGKKVIIVSKDDYIEDGKVSISNKNDTLFEEAVFEKDLSSSTDEIETMIKIRDFIQTITNKQTLFLIDQINKNKQELEKELSKNKPNMSTVKDIIQKEVELTKVLESVKKETGIITSQIDSSSATTTTTDTEVIIHDFSNGAFNITATEEVLEELTDFAVSENMPLTNAQIMALLK